MRNRNLLLIVVGIGGLVIFLCVACFALGLIGSFTSSTATPTVRILSQVTEGTQPTDTLVPTNTSEPTNTLAPAGEPESSNTAASGGLGLSQTEWEQTHTQTGKDILGSIYDEKYVVVFQADNVWYIERQWSTENAVTPDAVEAESQSLIPADSQFVKTYTPEGRPETTVNLYMSESLKSRFNPEDSITGDWWTGGEPGNFTVQYNQYDAGVTRMIIALGNNP